MESFSKPKIILLFTAIVAVCAGIDQAIKLWVQSHMMPYDSIPVLSFFNLRFGFNTGVSFSMLSDFGADNVWGLVAFNGALVALLCYWAYVSNRLLEIIGYALIVGGALGNIFDRITLGAVVDYLDFHYMGWHFPTFNGADVFITLGVMVLLWDTVFGTHTTPTEQD